MHLNNYTVLMDPKAFAAIATDIASKPAKFSMWYGEHELVSREMEFRGAAMTAGGQMLIEFGPVVVAAPELKLVAREVVNGPVGSVSGN